MSKNPNNPEDNRLKINRTKKGISFGIKVLPRASREQLAGILDGKLKIKLTAPPVSGKANNALVKYLSKLLGVNKNLIKITHGETSTHKQILIADDNIEPKLNSLCK